MCVCVCVCVCKHIDIMSYQYTPYFTLRNEKFLPYCHGMYN